MLKGSAESSALPFSIKYNWTVMILMEMKKIVMAMIPIICFLIPFMSEAQDMKALLDSIADPPMERDSSLQFDRTSAEMTIKDSDAPRRIEFHFTNTGDKPLTLTRVFASCSCTVARYSAAPVQPGEKGIITVIYNPHNQTGEIDRSIYVYTEVSEIHPVARLRIRGEVIASDRFSGYRCVMGQLRLKYTDVNFGNVTREMKRKERILCANAGDTPIKVGTIPLMCPDWIRVCSEPSEIGPGQEAEIIVTIDGDRIPQGLGGKIEMPVILDGPQCAPSKRTLKITLELAAEQ